MLATATSCDAGHCYIAQGQPEHLQLPPNLTICWAHAAGLRRVPCSPCRPCSTTGPASSTAPAARPAPPGHPRRSPPGTASACPPPAGGWACPAAPPPSWSGRWCEACVCRRPGREWRGTGPRGRRGRPGRAPAPAAGWPRTWGFSSRGGKGQRAGWWWGAAVAAFPCMRELVARVTVTIVGTALLACGMGDSCDRSAALCMSLHHVTAPCHCTMSLHHVTAPCHCTMSLHHVTAPCHCTMSLHHASHAS
jgi:hypothetical protein